MKQAIESKPPPIFIAAVDNIKPLIEELNKVAKEIYYNKASSSEQVKMEPKDRNAYNNIINMLNEK